MKADDKAMAEELSEVVGTLAEIGVGNGKGTGSSGGSKSEPPEEAKPSPLAVPKVNRQRSKPEDQAAAHSDTFSR